MRNIYMEKCFWKNQLKLILFFATTKVTLKGQIPSVEPGLNFSITYEDLADTNNFFIL